MSHTFTLIVSDSPPPSELILTNLDVLKHKQHRGVTGHSVHKLSELWWLFICTAAVSSSFPSSSSSSSADRQERPPGDHLSGGLRGPPAEAAEGQTDAEGDGRVYPREVTALMSDKTGL